MKGEGMKNGSRGGRGNEDEKRMAEGERKAGERGIAGQRDGRGRGARRSRKLMSGGREN